MRISSIDLDVDLFIHALTFSFNEIKLIVEGASWHTILRRFPLGLSLHCVLMDVAICGPHVYLWLFFKIQSHEWSLFPWKYCITILNYAVCFSNHGTLHAQSYPPFFINSIYVVPTSLIFVPSSHRPFLMKAYPIKVNQRRKPFGLSSALSMDNNAGDNHFVL